MNMDYHIIEEVNLCVYIPENEERCRVYHLVEKLGFKVEPCENPQYIRIKDVRSKRL